MSTILCTTIPENFTHATIREEFFDSFEDRNTIEKLERREQARIGVPGESCKTNLFFGFFFDGTRNNYEKAAKTGEQSNVARLYDLFPGQAVPGVLPVETDWKYNPGRFTHFFRVYIPGVASTFKEVNDSGAGWDETFGAAAGKKGCERIVWALIQAINNVNRYFHQQPLISSSEATALSERIDLSREARRIMTQPGTAQHYGAGNWSVPRIEFEKLLRRLHANVAQHWSKNGARPAKIDPGIVETIYISTFGFSRGATQARAFANWLDSLCRLDASIRGEAGSSLGGFPVEFDFLGLFDTVASVGLGNTLGNFPLLRAADGHGAWADAEDSLRIPGCIKSCVHLVAGHELRRSFPCDSIAVGFTLPERTREIVFPGVHSDVGGGYGPMQQGKGLDSSGADMLSRVPLLYMYKQARLAGVPLKLELASGAVQSKFSIASKTIADFNAYLSRCTKTSGSLTDIVREQAILQMSWRYARRDRGPAPLHGIPSFLRATNFDKNDLESANKEFNDELHDFEEAMAKRDRPARRQNAGFDNKVENEWEEIATYWPLAQPDPVVAHFFDEYVHDSRSGFKLTGDDSEAKALVTLGKWSRRLRDAKRRYESSAYYGDGATIPGPPDYGMGTNERMAAEDYDKTGTVPRYITGGREPYRLGSAGYFRFRKIYGGSDTVLLSNWQPPQSRHTPVVASAAHPHARDTDHPSHETT